MIERSKKSGWTLFVVALVLVVPLLTACPYTPPSY